MKKSDKKVFIVDDEPDLREVLNTLFQQEGYQTVLASDGKMALDLVKKNIPDVILLDVNMPKMNGFQVLEKLKKDKLTMDIPVIMVTARDGNEDIQEGISHFADKYITKPYDIKKLLMEVEKTLTIKDGTF